MKQGSLYETLFQIGALIFVVIIVHATYVTVIRPNAELIQEQQQLLQQELIQVLLLLQLQMQHMYMYAIKMQLIL